MTPFEQAVLDVVAGLRPGDVLTYGEVAAEAGHPGAARGVGAVLRASDGLPWWRVVGAGGRLVSPNAAEQARLLAAEGRQVERGRVR